MISRRSSARITISASRNAVLPTTVTMAIAQWNLSSTANASAPLRGFAVDSTINPGTRVVNAELTGATSFAWRTATLMALTDSADSGSSGSLVRTRRSGRWRRASSRRAGNFRGSGVGSYTPATRNCLADRPLASAASVTRLPTLRCSCSTSWRDSRTSATGASARSRTASP